MNKPFHCENRRFCGASQVARAFRRASMTGRNGAMVLTLIVLAFVTLLVVGSILSLSAGDMRITRISLDQQRAEVTAEAGLDYGVMLMRDIVKSYQLNTSIAQSDLQDALDLLPPPPSLSGAYTYTTPSGNTSFRIIVDTPVSTGIISNGIACRGLYGTYQLFSIVCGARNPSTGVSSVLRQRVQALSVYVVRYGVFYEDDLEILPGATMTFRGPVHSNNDIYLGGPLSFYDKLSSAGSFYHHRKDTAETPGETFVMDTHNNLVSMKPGSGANVFLDSSDPTWTSQSLVRWQGNMLSEVHGVTPLRPPIDPLSSNHDIIERSIPPFLPSGTTNPLYSAATESEKFANKAALRIFVSSNGTISVTNFYTNAVIRSSLLGTNTIAFTNPVVLKITGTNATTHLPTYQKDGDGVYTMIKTGMVAIGSSFFDAREQTNMAPVDIYLDKLLLNYPDLYQSFDEDHGQNIIYVTRDTPTGIAAKPCIRLRNGVNLITALTVASDLPVYIEGDYNNTNSVNTTAQPALITADAVTLLSTAWQDAKSTLGSGSTERMPAPTTYNCVIMTGNTTTSWGSYNGGLENVLRFLENWANKTVTFRGSIIDLWQAEKANAPWYIDTTGVPSSQTVKYRYSAPTRDWGYDTIYRYANPPGMTKVFGMEETLWERINWADAGW